MKISVVIPTHNRVHSLGRCIEALHNSDFDPADYEIIAVDDAGSRPVTLPEFNDGAPRTTAIRLDTNSGPGVARNQGVQAALGELIAFTDDDCLVEPRWLSELWQARLANPGAMLGGKLTNAQPQHIGSVANQVISDIVYAHYNAVPQQARFFASNNMAVPRSAFMEMGGFDPQFSRVSEDRDLCDRWRFAKRPMVFVPTAVASHDKVLSTRQFLRLQFHYGCGARDYHVARTRRGSGTMSQEMGFHGELSPLLRKATSPLSVGRRLQVLPYIAAWQVANVAGYFWRKFIRSSGSG